MSEHDLVDVVRAESGVGDRIGRHLDDQRLDVLGLVPAEWRVAPADDACGHDGLLTMGAGTVAGQFVRAKGMTTVAVSYLRRNQR